MHIIYPFPSGPLLTNAYVVACPTTYRAAIVDPSQGSAEVVKKFIADKKLQPKMILITHSHWDHIVDAAELQQHFQIPVYVHALDAPNLQYPGSDRLGRHKITPVTPEGYLNDGDKITIGDLQFEVIHTPGHSPGGVCLYCPKHHLLLSGDTLFKGTMGRIDLPTGQPNLMWESLKKLAKLPAETQVYPGHGPSTTIGAEKWLTDPESVFG